MPHKHVRKGNDNSNFNLAPSQLARPLATRKPSAAKARAKKAGRPKPETGNGYKHDDTPRAFARMMALKASNKRQRSGLDDGEDSRAAKKKQRKTDSGSTTTAASTTAPTQPAKQPAPDLPKILPGERLGDFAARVDQALPVTGLARKGKVQIDGVKERRTKTEKRLQKMYASWRDEEARLKEKEEERLEQAEEAEEERDAELGGQNLQVPTSSRKAKRRKMIGEQHGDDDDPWAELKLKREGRKGLHDVVQAPPSFKTVPKEKFKVREGARVDVADVPTKAGSLKRREELGDARREVIERYRAMMGKRNG